MSQTEDLMTMLRRRHDDLDEQGCEVIDPAVLAESVYVELDPLGTAPTLVRFAAILELRQLSREICRERHVLAENEPENGNLFERELLQPRYPATRNGSQVYVLRSKLTTVERQRNVNRLLKESTAKQNHAAALLAETNDLISQGKLEPLNVQNIEHYEGLDSDSEGPIQ